MPLVLNNIHGFADVPDSVLAHDTACLGLSIGKISDNAAMGIVRLEVFSAIYKHGDTVALPVSAVDGYNYSRSELMYLWAPVNTGSPNTQWASDGPPWTMWYAAINVNQLTGVVTSSIGYRGNQDHKDRQAKTNDGNIQVWTIAQRGLTTMVMAAQPAYKDLDDAQFVTDLAVTQSMLQTMNRSAKFGIVNTEVVNMGVFKNGDTVPTAVSPVDGYAYSYAEMLMMTSLYWTADDDGATPANLVVPDLAKGQLDDWKSSVDPLTGQVSITISYESSGTHTYNTGRISVIAFCQRGGVIVPATAMPWSDTLPGNSAFPLHGSSYTYGTGPIVAADNLVAGQVLKLSASGIMTIGSGFPQNGPAGELYSIGTAFPGTATTGWFPTKYVSGASTTTGLGGLCGAFVDFTGNVIQAIFVGAGGTFTVPVGATKLQLGTNDNVSYADNGGGFAVMVALTTGSNPNFSEIDGTTFMPGQTLRASTMKTLQDNIRAAVLVPEFFGPTNYTDGQTIPTPVSTVDGYVYGRSELAYVWDWVDTGPTTSTFRMVMSAGSIDSSGVVHCTQYRFPSGASNWSAIHIGTMRVLVVAKRNVTAVIPTAPASQPLSGSVTDDGSGAITVNNV